MIEASKPSCYEADRPAGVRVELIVSGEENKNLWHIEHFYFIWKCSSVDINENFM
jgi:hypothetical protein